jgi:tetratricopeptide (TPR) repeat protein
MLAALVRAGGDVVSTAWMREALWGDAPVEERNLNQQIYMLRRVLRRDPRVTIENVPRRGYRLVVAPVAAVPAPAAVPARVRRRSFLSLAACAAIALLAILLPPERPSLGADRDVALGNYLTTAEGPHHLDRAAAYYRDLVARYPGGAAGYGGLAIVDAKRALDAGTDLPRRQAAFMRGSAEAAMALSLNPKESNALTAFGIIAAVRDHCMQTARRMFDGAVAADPTAELPRTWRAKFLLSVGDFYAAGNDFRAISQIAPTSGYAVGLYGEWLLLHHNYARASEVLAQAVDLGNHPGFTRYWLAKAYYMQGRDAQALEVSNQLLGLYPGEASALVLRLRIEARDGDMRGALADYRQLREIRDPAQMDPIALASADVAMGKPTEALQTVRGYVSSGLHGIDEIGRIRTDPDFDSLRSRIQIGS